MSVGTFGYHHDRSAGGVRLCLLHGAVCRLSAFGGGDPLRDTGAVFDGGGHLSAGILLIPGYAALFLWAVGVNRMLYAHGMGREYYGGYGRQSYLKKGMQMAGIIAVIIVGCILESYVNPKMLQFVLKIF